jgi:hypothetical protein
VGGDKGPISFLLHLVPHNPSVLGSWSFMRAHFDCKRGARLLEVWIPLGMQSRHVPGIALGLLERGESSTLLQAFLKREAAQNLHDLLEQQSGQGLSIHCVAPQWDTKPAPGHLQVVKQRSSPTLLAWAPNMDSHPHTAQVP